MFDLDICGTKVLLPRNGGLAPVASLYRGPPLRVDGTPNFSMHSSGRNINCVQEKLQSRPLKVAVAASKRTCKGSWASRRCTASRMASKAPPFARCSRSSRPCAATTTIFLAAPSAWRKILHQPGRRAETGPSVFTEKQGVRSRPSENSQSGGLRVDSYRMRGTQHFACARVHATRAARACRPPSKHSCLCLYPRPSAQSAVKFFGIFPVQSALRNLTMAARSAAGMVRKFSFACSASPPCQRIASSKVRARPSCR